MRFRFWRIPIGERGERIAARALRKHGYTILDRNVQAGRYEIDIVAREGDTVAFVEVKTRASGAFAAPEVNVDPRKQQHIARAAQYWIQRHGAAEDYYRFDVVSVVLPRGERPVVEIIRDAF